VGGRTLSHRSGGHVLDTGAGFFTNFYPRLKSYNQQLGLENDVVKLSRQNVLIHEGKAAPLSLGSPLSFIRFPLIGAADKFQMIWRTLGRTFRHRRLDLADPSSMAKLDTESIATDARRQLGERTYQFLVRPGIEPFWYFSCENVSRSLYIGLQAKAADAVFYTYRSGMDILCQSLVRGLDVRTGQEIRSIRWADNKFRVITGNPGDTGQDFEELVIATTAEAAAGLTRGLPEAILSPAQRSFIDEQAYVANVQVTFRIPRGLLPDSDTRIPCGPGENPVAAITVNSDKRSTSNDEDLLSIYLRGELADRLLDAGEKQTFSTALELAQEVDQRLRYLKLKPFHVKCRQRAIPVHSVGRYRKAAEFIARQRRPLVFAGDYLSTATIEGALFTGQQAVLALDG